jgi:Tfp pilus tip-associated adhesin PilY1
VLIAGTNDGQAHIFDAGFFRGPNGDPTGSCEANPVTNLEFVVGDFDNGTGRELFSYVPRTTMPKLDLLKDIGEHNFTVDGRIARGDVFIDPLQPDGIPDADQREWRSVLVGTFREGGSGLYAIDITQPDQLIECDDLEQIPVARTGTLDYVPSCADGGLGCGTTLNPTTRYPELMWEFDDRKDCIDTIVGGLDEGKCDDDSNLSADLADTWSRPTIARIRVDSEPDGAIVDKYVAVFGGGMDPEGKDALDQSAVKGNFLFMVDMETGRAIYKRAVVGSVAGDPAVVDTDQNGYHDTVYFGTTAGFLYKVDISSVELLEDLGSWGNRITSINWEPFPILTTAGRPIYHEPTVIFVTELGLYAVAVGTGDREDLWFRDPIQARDEGRFYMFVDRNFARIDLNLPLTEINLQQIALSDANTGADYLRQSPYGWYIALESGERVISEAFSLAGVTIFSTYEPLEAISEDGAVCQRFGNSRVFVVTTTSGNTLLSSGERFFIVEGGFLSPPFAETSQTKNPTSGDGGPTGDDLPDDMVSVVDEIKKLLPTNCKYANYTINIKSVRDDTGIQFLAAIPVCTVETNWKDF